MISSKNEFKDNNKLKLDQSRIIENTFREYLMNSENYMYYNHMLDKNLKSKYLEY